VGGGLCNGDHVLKIHLFHTIKEISIKFGINLLNWKLSIIIFFYVEPNENLVYEKLKIKSYHILYTNYGEYGIMFHAELTTAERGPPSVSTQ
jgi:hypothetical protein